MLKFNQAWALSSWSASLHLLPPMISWWLFMISGWVHVVKYPALTYVDQLEVSQAGKLTRRIIFEPSWSAAPHLLAHMLMVADDLHNEHVVENQLHLAVSADPGCELINHSPTISSCLRAIITACFQHLPGQLIIARSYDCLVKQLSGFLWPGLLA